MMTRLLAPSFTEAQDKSPVNVFILAGQSNMQGHGRISLGKDGDLDYAATREQFSYLKKDANWVERNDVWYYHKNGKGEVTKSNLKPGLGSNSTSVGPELVFGLANCSIASVASESLYLVRDYFRLNLSFVVIAMMAARSEKQPTTGESSVT